MTGGHSSDNKPFELCQPHSKLPILPNHSLTHARIPLPGPHHEGEAKATWTTDGNTWNWNTALQANVFLQPLVATEGTEIVEEVMTNSWIGRLPHLKALPSFLQPHGKLPHKDTAKPCKAHLTQFNPSSALPSL